MVSLKTWSFANDDKLLLIKSRNCGCCAACYWWCKSCFWTESGHWWHIRHCWWSRCCKCWWILIDWSATCNSDRSESGRSNISNNSSRLTKSGWPKSRRWKSDRSESSRSEWLYLHNPLSSNDPIQSSRDDYDYSEQLHFSAWQNSSNWCDFPSDQRPYLYILASIVIISNPPKLLSNWLK